MEERVRVRVLWYMASHSEKPEPREINYFEGAEEGNEPGP